MVLHVDSRSLLDFYGISIMIGYNGVDGGMMVVGGLILLRTTTDYYVLLQSSHDLLCL